MQSESQQEIKRLRVGDPHSENASLFFMRHKRGKEVWVTQERLDQERKRGNESNKKNRKTEEYRKKRRQYCNARYQIPEVKARMAAKTSSPEFLAKRKARYRSNPAVYEKIKEYRKNPLVRDGLKRSLAKWRETHGKAYKKKYYELCKQNPDFRILVNARSRVYDALRQLDGIRKKETKTKDLLGCSVEFFLGWLESKFERGMSWMNYGVFWEVDHIRPCASFLLSDESQLRECFHYTNCQPLWKNLNLEKSDKLPDGTRGREVRTQLN